LAFLLSLVLLSEGKKIYQENQSKGKYNRKEEISSYSDYSWGEDGTLGQQQQQCHKKRRGYSEPFEWCLWEGRLWGDSGPNGIPT